VTKADFRRFTHIVALDEQNLRDLKQLRPADATANLSLMLDHAPGRAGQAVADPYYGDDAGFETTWADVSAAAAGLVQTLRAREA
jgi:protein-tyrosine phosphatase